MKTTGFRLVFEQRRTTTVEDLEVQVAPVPVVVLLKMAAYRDDPTVRGKDLEDLAFILEDYPEREARFAPDLLSLGLSYSQSAPFLLGRELGALVNDAERREVLAFLEKVHAEDDPHATLAKMSRGGPRSWQDDPQEVTARLDALRQGLLEASPVPQDSGQS
jgi:predicted nucleotidyltransferase